MINFPKETREDAKVNFKRELHIQKILKEISETKDAERLMQIAKNEYEYLLKEGGLKEVESDILFNNKILYRAVEEKLFKIDRQSYGELQKEFEEMKEIQKSIEEGESEKIIKKNK
ncbi:MAG: hypothetical protein ABH808_03230 [Candidatus Kuenenbacteria bacterium]